MTVLLVNHRLVEQGTVVMFRAATNVSTFYPPVLAETVAELKRWIVVRVLYATQVRADGYSDNAGREATEQVVVQVDAVANTRQSAQETEHQARTALLDWDGTADDYANSVVVPGFANTARWRQEASGAVVPSGDPKRQTWTASTRYVEWWAPDN